MSLDHRSIALRKLVVRALLAAGRGHVGPSLSLIEILRVLYDDIMSFRPEDPNWRQRDRLVLSKGHGCLALYALLADHGFFDLSELDNFCAPDGILGGHPEKHKIPGVEASTGALGHGLPIAVGMALAGRLHGDTRRTFVVVGDGELQEGSNWEAAIACCHHKIEELTLIVDRNGLQIFGATECVAPLEPLADKLTAFGFVVSEVDGHNIDQLKTAFERRCPDQSHAVICNTIKGRGLPEAENNLAWHYLYSIDEELARDMVRSLDSQLRRDGAQPPK